MIDSKVMEIKLKQGEAKLIKVSERKSKKYGVYIKVAELNGVKYKICPSCNFYLTLDRFTKLSNGSYHVKCKACRSTESKQKYYRDIDTHLRIRLHTINKRVKKDKDKCTLQEFREFFFNAKDPFTNRTLYDDWVNPHPNPNLRLEVDHIIPTSEGGGSKPDNLQVVPKFYNALKKDCSSEQLRETLDFIAKFFTSESHSSYESDDFSGEVLKELVEEGFTGDELLREFDFRRKQIRPAFLKLLEDAKREAEDVSSLDELFEDDNKNETH